MKRAVMTVASVSLSCPECAYPLTEPDSGSYVWETTDIRKHLTVRCSGCGVESSVIPPAALRAHGL